jgi:diguanylate cyclase (GGDEF)-like protein
VYVDKLTGLYNRTWLNEELANELQGKRSGCAALIIKPDNFKEINDTYGHDAGDKTLALLGSAVQHLAVDKGIPARHGGDVFAVIFKNANSRQIRSFSRSVLRYINSLDLTDIISADDFRLTVSVGVAVRTRGCRVPMTDIIQNAFDRMLVARESGGNRVCDTENAHG